MAKETTIGRELGPIEYIVVAFAGNQFKREIIPALCELVYSGQIRIIDLAVVIKDGDGDVKIFESTEVYSEIADALMTLTGEFNGLLSEEDLLMVGDELPVNTTAAAMLFEHVWASRFASAVRNANGWLMSSARIPADVIDAARQTLIEAAATM